MIPREILKTIRPSELRTNRFVTETLDLARFLVSTGRHRVLAAENKASRLISCVFEVKTDVPLPLSYVAMPQTNVGLRQNDIHLSLGDVHLRIRYVGSRLGNVLLWQIYVRLSLRYMVELLNHVGLRPGYIPDSQRNILWRRGWVVLSADTIARRLSSVRFAPGIPDFSFA